MKMTDASGARIAYDVTGPDDAPVLLCLPGWAVGRSFFGPVAARLARSWRVVTMDWRGHGDSERPAADFGHGELAADALAVIDAVGAERVVPLAQAHGGWVAIELARRLGPARVPRIVAASWLVLGPPPPFAAVLAALQDPARWTAARDQLFAMWLAGAYEDLARAVRADMGRYGFDTWARAGREIAAEYARHGSPLRALASLPAPPRFLHLYAQPRAPEPLAAQEAFAKEHPWFSVRRFDAATHFPPLEIPDASAAAIGVAP